MSLFSTLNVGASGLGVASTGLSVAGDNIANIGTTGYKQTRATFADFLPQDVFGLAGTSQVGTGAATNNITTLFGQGTLEGSDSSLDMAINGKGFFVVNSGDNSYYTRAGEFYTDDSGYVVTASGLRLQGYTATDGALSPVVGDIQIENGVLPATATTEIELSAQLSAETEAGTDLAALSFYGTGTGTYATMTEAGDAADFSTSVTIYDSLGVSHEVTVLFERTSSTDWTWRAVADASEVYDSTGTPYTTDENYAFELATGTCTFDSTGALTSCVPVDTTGWTFYGAATQTLTFDFGVDSSGVATDGELTMSGSESSATSISQDGMTTGSLTSLEVDADGTISGTYSNGEEVTLGQVALASFKAESGLKRLGGTLFGATVSSGEAAVGVAGTGGRGSLTGSALEKSNVELEDQFVQMITYQRAYQASAKVVTAADESLQTLVNLL